MFQSKTCEKVLCWQLKPANRLTRELLQFSAKMFWIRSVVFLYLRLWEAVSDDLIQTLTAQFLKTKAMNVLTL